MTDPEYRWLWKVKKNRHNLCARSQEHLKCKTGVFIDVFPMDDIPHSTIGQMLNDFYCFCLRKFCGLEVGKYSTLRTEFTDYIIRSYLIYHRLGCLNVWKKLL